MAKLSQDKTYVTVESGDTLSAIALEHLGDASKYKQLATINGISNPNYISVGQKIYLSKQTSSGTTTNKTSKTTTSNCVKIDNFGLQSNADNVLFATWVWSKSNTEHYEYKWQYATGDGIWFVGTDGTTKDKQCTYSIPKNATRIRFNVKPISKKYTKNNKETSYWTANWAAWRIFEGKFIHPEKPGTPSVTMDGFKLTATLDNITSDATKIEFEIVKDDKTVFRYGKYSTVAITKAHASYSCNVPAGGKYKVRCRAIKNSLIKSDWSEYSESYNTPPTTPSKILVLKATSSTSVYIDWENSSNVKEYEIQWTTDSRYFDTASDVQSATVDASVAGRYNATGLSTGEKYFFRVRAKNESGESAWSEIKSITLGRAPSAPSTWSSTTTVITGEELKLYWIHNSEDGSSQTYAELEIIKGSHTDKYTIKNSTDEYEKDKTSEYVLDTSAYTSGEKIEWRVRTAGILTDASNNPVYGEWSVVRTVDIYAPPTLSLTVSDKYGSALDTITSFPFYIVGIAEQSNQIPVSYHVSIVSNEIYETVDNVGNKQIVNVDDIVYTKDVDTSGDIMIEMSPGNVNLDNGISYTCHCTVAMSSGLTASSSADFTVSWVDQEYEPNAEISVDSETLTAQIRPYCENGTLSYRVVTNDVSGFVVTEEELDFIYGDEVENVVTTTGEQVYTGMDQNGDIIYYCIVENRALVENVLLSVYRREFDGEFTQIATGLVNTNYTTVTDPHPALDYARYRIVATDQSTGAISYVDIPGVPVGEKSAVIQWDEEWSTFDVTNEDALEQPAWSGSLLKLTGNLDVSDSNDKDVTLIEYIGRKHPVRYSGTHLGEKQVWNVEIPKDNTELVYSLRRLKNWLGDVYVREPSGSGFWATVDVSFNKKHCEVTIPVTINITRVEGGI